MSIFNKFIDLDKLLWSSPNINIGLRSVVSYKNGILDDTVLTACNGLLRVVGNSNGDPVSPGSLGYIMFVASDTIYLEDPLFGINASISYRFKEDNTIVVDQFTVNEARYEEASWGVEDTKPLVSVYKLINDLEINKSTKNIRIAKCLNLMGLFLTFIIINNIIDDEEQTEVFALNNAEYNVFLNKTKILSEDIVNKAKGKANINTQNNKQQKDIDYMDRVKQDIESIYFIDEEKLSIDEELNYEKEMSEMDLRPEITYEKRNVRMEISYKKAMKLIDIRVRKGLTRDPEFKELKTLKDKMSTTKTIKDYATFLIEMSAYYVCLSERLERAVYKYLPTYASKKIGMDQTSKVIKNAKYITNDEYLHSAVALRLKDVYLRDRTVNDNNIEILEQALLNQFNYYKYLSVFFKDMATRNTSLHYDMHEHYNSHPASAEMVDYYFNFFISAFSDRYGRELFKKDLF